MCFSPEEDETLDVEETLMVEESIAIMGPINGSGWLRELERVLSGFLTERVRRAVLMNIID